MNTLTISNRPICNSTSGFLNSYKKCPTFRKLTFGSRFNLKSYEECFTLNKYEPPLFHNSVSGFFKSSKRVTNSHKKVTTLKKLSFGSYDGECCNVRKCGDLIKAMCGENIGSVEYDDGYYMRKGLELAGNAIGCTSPNPMVGCVIVKDGQVVGQGFHPKAGQPHAEVFALRDAGEMAENATAYVTLEPCNHYGETPPCSEALIKAKVKKVVVGMVDPNPIVSSRGIDRLQEAGIEVVVGVEEELCKKLNEAFIHKMLFKKPFVALRYSISINGVHSQQLGENASKHGGYYSKLLQEYDAVIHSPTLITQEISQLVSHEPNARQPLNIFITNNQESLTRILKLPIVGGFKAIIFSDKEFPLEPKISENGIEIVVMDHVSLDAILDYCNTQGFCNVLVDSRGNLDGLKEILSEGFKESLLQKVVVEVLPFWVENEVDPSLPQLNLNESTKLKHLSSSISGDSVILEGHF